jgi:DNA polymerase-3 subunit delta
VKYDNIRAFEKHLEGASPLHFSRHYLIMAKEEFDCKEAINLLLDFLLPPQNRDLILHKIDGAEVSLDDLLTDLHSQSMFAPMKVIWIKQAEKLKKPIIDELEKYLSRIPRTQYLVLSTSGIAKNTRFYKASEKEGVVLELPEIKPWEREKQLIDWVIKKAQQSQKLMPQQVSQALVKYVGTDALTLVQELDKLFCYVGDRKEIQMQDIRAICTYNHVDTVWQLGEAIFRRDAATALRIARTLLLDGQSLLPLLRQIRSQFQTEFHICTLLQQGKPPHFIQQEYPYMKGQILERHIESATQYGLEAFHKGILTIDETEMQAKNSQIEEQLLAELLMIQLTKKD